MSLLCAASYALAGLTGAGMAQAAAGWAALARFRRSRTGLPHAMPGVTLLKPLHGDEPMLEEALASVCAQDYPQFQIVFGVQDHRDTALPVLQRLRERFPRLDVAVVVNHEHHGENRKIGNLINMLPHARHDVLVIADSDMHVEPGYLRDLVAALARPGIGLVTTLYTGLPATDTVTGQLGAAYVNHTFLPGALLARALGRQDCLGATMALHRDTLERIGGLHALVDHLADDAVLGRLVRAQGLGVALARTVPATTVPETNMPALFEHELRWARTVKSVEPTGFVLSAMQHPLFFAALNVGVSGGAPWAWAMFAAAWAGRAGFAHLTDRALGVPSGFTAWFLPFRDLFSVTVMIASYRTRRVAWRGRTLQAARPGLRVRKGMT